MAEMNDPEAAWLEWAGEQPLAAPGPDAPVAPGPEPGTEPGPWDLAWGPDPAAGWDEHDSACEVRSAYEAAFGPEAEAG